MTVSSPNRRDELASPDASRHRVSAWRDPRLVVGIALVALCALLGATLLGRGDGTVGVWATRTELAESQDVTAEDLVRHELRFAEQADADRYLPADQPVPEGLVLSRPLGAGELVPRSAVGAGTPEQSVEVPLSVPSDSVPSTVGVGSSVDVWVVPDRELDARTVQAEAALVLDDVRVVELARLGGGLGGTRQVVVALDRAQEDTLPSVLARVAQGVVVLVRTP
ncbi:MAG: hypothetical protein H0V42_11815 [Nocardioidaceae bacterium]|nr:hypothetical protein [Nocardioidaceae bacterium]